MSNVREWHCLSGGGRSGLSVIKFRNVSHECQSGMLFMNVRCVSQGCLSWMYVMKVSQECMSWMFFVKVSHESQSWMSGMSVRYVSHKWQSWKSVSQENQGSQEAITLLTRVTTVINTDQPIKVHKSKSLPSDTAHVSRPASSPKKQVTL